MCTYNGARWLPEQLASIAGQTHKNWTLVVSDDGSTDNTCNIVRTFGETYPVILYEAANQNGETRSLAPSQRAARNYMQTLSRPDLPLSPNSYLALSDQDDVWYPDKLAHGLGVLASAENQFALYGGQSRHIDQDGRVLAHSHPLRRGAGLRNALVQNVISGHSAILTPQATTQVRDAGVPVGIWYHDWWIYLLLSAMGAQVIVDDHVGLDYRQHAGNVMGAGRGHAARLRRLRQIFNGAFGHWIHANLTALNRHQHSLTPQARTSCAALKTSPIRAQALWRSKAYRQNPIETMCLLLAATMRKL
ncbi:glycosyltransferase [Thalassorhabdomicrobium marinisediminis]|nr:glycosyltransferase [Thalassorhabdomicrobium marinisediminis]